MEIKAKVGKGIEKDTEKDTEKGLKQLHWL
jgi:hypothetical protein